MAKSDPLEPDIVEGIVDDVLRLYPGLDVIGLPVTGRVLRLSRYIEARRVGRLAEFELTVADFDVLATMRRKAGDGTINVRDLQQSLMLSSGGTTKRLDRLETRNLIERLPDPNDRRGVLIGLTHEGIEMIDEAIPAITRLENEVVGSVLSQRGRDGVANGLRDILLSRERPAGDVEDD